MRFILALFAILAAFVLLRSLLEPLVKALATWLNPAAGTTTAQEFRAETPPRTGELKKDPVCGTFVAPEVAVTQTIKGQVVHFCSPKCRDEYARRA